MIAFNARMANSAQSNVQLDLSPDVCPICHSSIVAMDMGANFLYNGVRLERVLQCPNTSCQVLFIAQYERHHQNAAVYNWKRSVPFEFIPTTLTETIKSVSPDFCEIYGQAEKAEQHGLSLVAGPGYRKALEFLIKDYACGLHGDKKAEIEKMLLGACIAEYVKSEQIKQIAKRAVWLGNDETHYVRKWADKDLNDLKKLISLTLHWIEAEKLSADIIKDMPEGGPAQSQTAQAT
jgi:hypothetical protein